RQDRGAHVHDVVADRQGGQDAPRLLLEQAAKLAGATIPVVAEPPKAKLVGGQQGGLRGREEGRQQQQQHQDEPAVRIARGLQRGPSRPFYRRSIASDYNTHGLVGMSIVGLRIETTGRSIHNFQSTIHNCFYWCRIFERNCCVLGWVGLVKKCSGAPSSTIAPSSMKRMRSVTSRAKPISWVTTIIVIPVSRASPRITSRT